MLLAVAYNKYKPLVSVHAAMVLKAIIYADVFNYPLTAQEIFERTTIESFIAIKEVLDELVCRGYIFFIDGFYTLQDDCDMIERRLKGNAKAKKYLRIAKRVTAIIRHFPFVRAVMLSGSISKNYIDEKSDIDYFIITAPNRLWVARLFFIICQKLIFFNKCKFFCYNYMIDEQHLSINHKSYYTAMEISTLVPVFNGKLYCIFLRYNDWIKQYFPNYLQHPTQNLSQGQSLLQQGLESIFNNDFGEWADKKLMDLTQKNWRKKSATKKFLNGKELELKRHTAKAHTQDHLCSITTSFNARLKQYEDMLNIHFDEVSVRNFNY